MAATLALDIAINQQAANRAKRELQNLREETADFAQQQRILDSLAQRAGRSLEDEARVLSVLERNFDTNIQSAGRLGSAFKELRDEAADSAAALDDLRKAGQGIEDIRLPRVTGGGRQQSLRSEIGAVGDIETAAKTIGGSLGAAGFSEAETFIALASEIPAATEAIGQMRQAIGELPQAVNALISSIGKGAGGLIGAFGALVIAVKILGDTTRENIDESRTAIESGLNVVTLAAQSTSQELEARRANLESQIAAQRQASETAAGFVDDFNAAIDDLDAGRRAIIEGQKAANLVVENIPFIGGEPIFLGELKGAEQAADTAADTLRSLEAELSTVNQALDSESVAANDAAAALAAAAEAERQRNTELEAIGIQTLTGALSQSSEQIQNRIAAIRDEIDLIGQLIDSESLSAAETEALTARLQNLFIEQQTLSGGIYDLVRAREAENTILPELTNSIQLSIDAINQRIANEIQLANLSEQSSAQLQDRLATFETERTAINNNIVALKELAATGDEDAVKAFEALKDRLAELASQTDLTNAALSGVISKEIAQLKTEITGLREGEVEQIKKLRADIEAATSAANAAFSAAVLKAEQEAKQDRINLFNETEQAKTDAQNEADKRREDLEADHQDRLHEIVRRANSTIANAAANRDALAALMAARNRDDQLREEDKNFKKQEKQIQTALDDQLARINQSYIDQNKAIDQRLAERIQTETQRRDEAIQKAEEQAAKERDMLVAKNAEEIALKQEQIAALQTLQAETQQQELTMKQQAATAELQLESQKQATLLQTVQSGGAAILSAFSSTIQQLVNTAQQSVGALNSALSLASQSQNLLNTPAAQGQNINQIALNPGQFLPAFASGTKVMKTGAGIVHKDELILNKQQQKQVLGGLNLNMPITINGTNMDESQLVDTFERRIIPRMKQVANQQLNNQLKAAGLTG